VTSPASGQGKQALAATGRLKGLARLNDEFFNSIGQVRRCLWIYDTDDQQAVAFTPDGMEYLREMVPQYKRNRSLPRS
jgi:hypothetical protein